MSVDRMVGLLSKKVYRRTGMVDGAGLGCAKKKVKFFSKDLM